MTRPRVCLVLGTASGGVRRHVDMLATGCERAGLEVRIAGPARVGASPFDAVAIGARPQPLADAVTVLRLRRLARGAGIDVMHAHGLRAGALAALALGRPRRARAALVVTVHNAPPPGRRAAAVYRALERIVARRADAVLCVSADLEDRMRRLGARATGRAVVAAARISPGGAGLAGPPRGPRESDAEPDPAAGAGGAGAGGAGGAGAGGAGAGGAGGAGAGGAGAGGAAGPRLPERAGGRPLVLAAGRLARQKGFDILLLAAARWRGIQPPPRLVIAGSGPLAGDLAARAAALGVDAAFLGERSDVTALLASADVVVVPSRWEGQPLIVQEALLAGRPVVAADVGGIRDLTGDDGALFVPPEDPGALATAVARVLGDPALAARLAAAAAAAASRLPSPDQAVGAALAVYRSVCRPAGRRGSGRDCGGSGRVSGPAAGSGPR